MRKLDLYWKTNPEWYDYTEEEIPKPFLTEKATEEAKESFKRYLEQIQSKSA